ncbi:hypothetical protein [Bacillus sp. Cr_A10]|uniref:hypothetical protein n=1 Tax=Bacillus sp. Cr_A10 TaxID=3033993 RepID=UPI0023DCC56E|nr:hypothetical protein [Bacillus sp. Cr_A10]MDF2066574.1 hypothetical protein [Bacillus sp. Cr_A10]
MDLVKHEINRLVDDYYKCEITQIKEQIINDIDFLTEAYLLHVEKRELEPPINR